MVAGVISDRGRRRKRRRSFRRRLVAFVGACARFVLAFAVGFTLLSASAWINGDLRPPVAQQEAPLHLRGLLAIDAPALSGAEAAEIAGLVPQIRLRRRERSLPPTAQPAAKTPEFDVLSTAELEGISQAHEPRR